MGLRPSQPARTRCIEFCTLMALWFVPAASLASPPSVTTFPTADSSVLVADDTTPYTVTTTLSDASGYSDIRCIRILFNYTESGGVQAAGRGYIVWGRTDADITQYGGAYVLADAGGDGRWGYETTAWGGTTYITPLSCQTTVTGKATGGSGSRTVTWTFTVKPAWALNPIMNDADIWFADSSYTLGWWDSPASFDVVLAACAAYATMPLPPVISTATTTTLNVAIDPNDSPTDVFVMKISPSVSGRSYVQADGTLGVAPVWQTKAAWATTTVKGLMWNTTYSFTLRANTNVAGYCPSPWGPAAQATTLDWVPVINYHHGTAFSPWVRGQCPYRSVPAAGYPAIWDLGVGSGARGLAGGLDADCYDWRDINSGSNWGLVGGHFTTLEFLQYARDHQAVPVLTANAFGGGYRDTANGGVFVCQTVNPGGLAADWVRFANSILQTYRQGDEAALTGDDLRIYNSIVDWGGRAKLLSPSEGVTPKVQYWEIGNEPELGGYGDFLTNHYLGPTDYRERYRLMSQAMLTVDPTLKIGPCLMTPGDPNGSGPWLAALAMDASIPIGFVGYHPYYSAIKVNWGYPDGVAGALRDIKAYLNGRASGIRSIMSQYGRSNYGLMATEWNPLNWDATGAQQSSMSMALGVAESCFTFAEDDVLAATFWEQPQGKLGASGAFAGLRDYMGDMLVTSAAQLGVSPSEATWRLYVTRDSADESRLMVWGLNFNENQPVTLNLALMPCRIRSAVLRHYGKPGAATSLMTYTGMAWDEQDITASFDPNRFSFTMESAEITLLVLGLAPMPDFDADGDVDLGDFAVFQYCFAGPNRPPAHDYCDIADLDGDADVDLTDFAVFQSCFNGPNRPPTCR